MEILKYIAKGRILGPFPSELAYFNGEKIFFAPIFTIPKADSTKENPRERVIVDFSIFMNEPMALRKAFMMTNNDMIW